MKLLDLIRQAHARFLFWKWDRNYHAANKRMRGCVHKNTMFVDVGVVLEKCRDCWALRVSALDGSDRMEWTPNSASPRYARQVQKP